MVIINDHYKFLMVHNNHAKLKISSDAINRDDEITSYLYMTQLSLPHRIEYDAIITIITALNMTQLPSPLHIIWHNYH